MQGATAFIVQRCVQHYIHGGLRRVSDYWHYHSFLTLRIWRSTFSSLVSQFLAHPPIVSKRNIYITGSCVSIVIIRYSMWPSDIPTVTNERQYWWWALLVYILPFCFCVDSFELARSQSYMYVILHTEPQS
jgi:hypothetical protein